MRRSVFPAVSLSAFLAASCGAPPASPSSSEEQEQPLASDTLVSERPIYGGIWRPSSGDQFLRLGRRQDAFIAEYNQLVGQGFRLVSLASNVVNGNVELSGVFDRSSTPQFVGLGRNFDQFVAEYGVQWNNGFRLVTFTANMVNGVVLYNGVWNASTAGQFLGLARNQTDFINEYGVWWNRGFRLAAITAVVVNGQPQYSGLWNPSTTPQFLAVGYTRADFEAEFGRQWNASFHLGGMTGHVQNDQAFYSGFWNPATGGQVVQFGAPEPEFIGNYGANWNNNFRLAAVVAPAVEALAINRVASKFSAGLSGRSTGHAVTVGYGGLRARGKGGAHRTSSDPPSSSASNTGRYNVASVTKTITAIAVEQLLHSRNITIEEHIAPFLPSDWVRGPNIGVITFRKLLTHTSGFRGNFTESYNDLRALIAQGIDLANLNNYSYHNDNYALFRVIIPYLNGFNDAGITNRPAALSAAYLNYMNTRVLGPAGITPTALRSTTSTPPLCYPFPAGSVRGWDFGDWWDGAGGAGLFLSTDELAKLLVRLREGALLPLHRVAEMENDYVGWQGAPGMAPQGVRHGVVRSHGGFLWAPTPNGNMELNSLILNFSTGAQVGIIVNSRSNADIYGTALAAYNDSWIPVR
jgi:CubicO group peptidase (beta-lactamase class C family)